MASVRHTAAVWALLITPSLAGTGPVIDLGYNLLQATSITTLQNTYDIYQFYDIRYAASTTGPNRFKAPQAPLNNRTAIKTGGQHWACPQANQSWNVVLEPFLQQYNFGQGKTTFERFDFPPAPPPNTAIDSRTTVDCLFLDLYVPKSVLDGVRKGQPGVPVLVQIVGGGYASGTKDLDPTGLFLRDREQGGNGLIVISINYRLGAFGFLAGNNFRKDGGVANAALLDQCFALQWVQKHICNFGGDPKNVTVIGESAGGGSIMYQITAYGGTRGPAPFQKALLQSPGAEPEENDAQRNTDYATFLKLLGVSNLAQARELPFTTVFAANVRQIYNASYGQFVYGPAVDGTFAPDLPAKLLLHGRFDREVTVMVGHNTDEGISFTSPFIQNTTSFKQDVASWLPARVATQDFLNFVADFMYPGVFDGSQGYTDQIVRTAKALSELVFTCNTFYLDKAFNNLTHAYYFAVPPAIHGSDLPYTYYPGPASSTNATVEVAVDMQRYFLDFVNTGNPTGRGLATWPAYSREAQVKVFNTTGNRRMQRDDVANERCNIWQRSV